MVILKCKILSLLILLKFVCGDWIESTKSLPNPFQGAGVGYDAVTNSIIIFGGYAWTTQDIYEYNIDDDTITELPTKLPTGYVFWGQAYTQINNIVYFISRSLYPHLMPHSLVSLTMDTKKYLKVSDFPSGDISIEPDRSCLCSLREKWLFVSGGYIDKGIFLDTVRWYNIRTNEWINIDSMPSLNIPRADHSCIGIGDSPYSTIYVFGGWNSGATIEKFELYEENATWVVLNDRLSGSRGNRAVIYNNQIYIIGPNVFVDIFEPLTDSISPSVPLEYGTQFTAAIAVQDTIYAFGGTWSSPHELILQSHWQYASAPLPILTSISPTYIPTAGPTNIPTEKPTQHPACINTQWTGCITSYINGQCLYGKSDNKVQCRCWSTRKCSYWNCEWKTTCSYNYQCKKPWFCSYYSAGQQIGGYDVNNNDVNNEMVESDGYFEGYWVYLLMVSIGLNIFFGIFCWIKRRNNNEYKPVVDNDRESN